MQMLGIDPCWRRPSGEFPFAACSITPMSNFPRWPIHWWGAPAARRVSLQAARESIVLLKNEGRTLPLKKTVRSILVNATDPRRQPAHPSAATARRTSPSCRFSTASFQTAPAGTTRAVYPGMRSDGTTRWPESEIEPEPVLGTRAGEIAPPARSPRGGRRDRGGRRRRILLVNWRVEGGLAHSLEYPGYRLDLVKMVAE